MITLNNLLVSEAQACLDGSLLVALCSPLLSITILQAVYGSCARVSLLMSYRINTSPSLYEVARIKHDIRRCVNI